MNRGQLSLNRAAAYISRVLSSFISTSHDHSNFMIEHVVQEMNPWYYQPGAQPFLPFTFYYDFLLSFVTFDLVLFFPLLCPYIISFTLFFVFCFCFLDTCDGTGRELLGIRRQMEGQAGGVLKCNHGAIFMDISSNRGFRVYCHSVSVYFFIIFSVQIIETHRITSPLTLIPIRPISGVWSLDGCKTEISSEYIKFVLSLS